MKKEDLERAHRLVQSMEALPDSKKEVLVAYGEGMAAMALLLKESARERIVMDAPPAQTAGNSGGT